MDRFRYYLRVRYGECDAQRVVFNSRYSEYVDIATSEFLRALGFGEAFICGDLDFQLVKQTIEWKAAARTNSGCSDAGLVLSSKQANVA